MEMKPQIRYLKELEKVVYDKEWIKKAKNFPVYYIFREISKPEPFDDLRIDLTIIPPKMLGREFVKTKGHYHIGNFGELYQVLMGEGIFLIQRKDLSDIYFVRASEGEFILIPPGYGHVTINPSGKILKIKNWIVKGCESDYQSIEKMEGFCYYLSIDGWIKNKIYKKIPKLREEKSLKVMPKDLKFLYG
jgi:glucose-6-phosphate isomerase